MKLHNIYEPRTFTIPQQEHELRFKQILSATVQWNMSTEIYKNVGFNRCPILDLKHLGS